MEEQFKVGDVVEAFGCRGTVKNIAHNSSFSVVVRFNNHGIERAFTFGGLEEGWHQSPSLTLIERPKKKVKRTYWWISYRFDTEGVRRTSHMQIEKSELDNLWLNAKDRQLHSIEIEEEE